MNQLVTFDPSRFVQFKLNSWETINLKVRKSKCYAAETSGHEVK